jgi:hypothetical protein
MIVALLLQQRRWTKVEVSFCHDCPHCTFCMIAVLNVCCANTICALQLLGLFKRLNAKLVSIALLLLLIICALAVTADALHAIGHVASL